MVSVLAEKRDEQGSRFRENAKTSGGADVSFSELAETLIEIASCFSVFAEKFSVLAKDFSENAEGRSDFDELLRDLA